MMPAGRWCVGVSGGADSIALLHGLRTFRPELDLVVAHLDHETRGVESAGDARFVADLCSRIGIEQVSAKRSEFHASSARPTEAAFRQARFALFEQVVRSDSQIAGVLLAHHADDRAETVVLRLLRGGEPWSAGGLRPQSTVGGIRVVRPLLGVRHAQLIDFLHRIGQPWREDESNTTEIFARNRVRRLLQERPELVTPLLQLADAADEAREWLLAAPGLADTFSTGALGDLPDPVARTAARRWLVKQGASPADVTAETAERLIALCRDLAMPGRQNFPGALSVRRQRGEIRVGDA